MNDRPKLTDYVPLESEWLKGINYHNNNLYTMTLGLDAYTNTVYYGVAHDEYIAILDSDDADRTFDKLDIENRYEWQEL